MSQVVDAEQNISFVIYKNGEFLLWACKSF